MLLLNRICQTLMLQRSIILIEPTQHSFLKLRRSGTITNATDYIDNPQPFAKKILEYSFIRNIYLPQ